MLGWESLKQDMCTGRSSREEGCVDCCACAPHRSLVGAWTLLLGRRVGDGVLQLYAAASQLRSFQVFTARVACDRVAAGYYIVFYL